MAKLISTRKKEADEADELMTLTQRVWEQVRENPSRTATIAGAIVGVVVIIFLATYLKEQAAEKRISAVSQAVGQYIDDEGEMQDRGMVLEELKTLAAKHVRTSPGGQALYFLGGLHVEQGDYGAAVEAYRQVSEEHASNETLAASATLARGYSHLLLDELDEALQVFNSLLAMGDVPLPRSQIELEIGAILERQGKGEEAAAAYRSLVESDPGGRWGNEAAARLRILDGA